ncbi:MAG TPA: hypothetical protein VE998_13380, partial [Terriglobales bacterium]|nr:hypothetical protein [Terriglobales bacterium]
TPTVKGNAAAEDRSGAVHAALRLYQQHRRQEPHGRRGQPKLLTSKRAELNPAAFNLSPEPAKD